MIFDAFDLIVVPFPFVDSPRVKPRPALVLSRRDFNQAKIFTLDNRLLQRRIRRLSERDVRT